jgi:hypothetical protein
VPADGGGLSSVAQDASTGGVDGALASDGADHAVIVPEDLAVMALPGGNGVLEVTALTLREGPDGAELYAALRNVGDVPACSAALSVELFDAAEQSLAAGIGGLLTQRFYRLTDGSGSIAACVGPGDVTLAAIDDLPADVGVDDVRYVIYRCPYFALDVVPIDGIVLDDVTALATDAGTAYTGTLSNGLDVAIEDPSVAVFPINGVGRPLGRATASAALALAPGDRWDFETDAVDVGGADQLAFAAGALAE